MTFGKISSFVTLLLVKAVKSRINSIYNNENFEYKVSGGLKYRINKALRLF